MHPLNRCMIVLLHGAATSQLYTLSRYRGAYQPPAFSTIPSMPVLLWGCLPATLCLNACPSCLCLPFLLPCPAYDLHVARLLLRNHEALSQLEASVTNIEAGGKQIVGEGNAWRRLLNLIMQLRKVVNHPFMLPDSEPGGEGTSTLPELLEASGESSLWQGLILDSCVMCVLCVKCPDFPPRPCYCYRQVDLMG